MAGHIFCTEGFGRLCAASCVQGVLWSKYQSNGEGGGDKTGEIGDEGCRDGVACFSDPGTAKIDGDGVERGLAATKQDSGYPSEIRVRAVFCH